MDWRGGELGILAGLSAVMFPKTKRAAEYSAVLGHAIFRSYDNPHTICQNLPESTLTSAGAEEG
jgi:hypothetical protein